jgi:poly-gamma-glutamate synthesis protein (capsule biosynthesis protein)
VDETCEFLIHMPVSDEAHTYGASTGQTYDFRPMTAKIKPLISSADLAICKVEVPMSATDTALHGYPVFNSPHELADAVKDTGYEGCSVATNHALDQGPEGVKETLDELDRVGVAHTGTARSADEANQIQFFKVKGVTVANLSYTYGTNGIPVPAGQPWLVNVTDVPTILAAAHRAKQEGAQYVVLSVHWGGQYQVAPHADEQLEAQQLLASPDVDLIFGDHEHVVQPVEKIGDKYVVFGMGNILSNQSAAT